MKIIVMLLVIVMAAAAGCLRVKHEVEPITLNVNLKIDRELVTPILKSPAQRQLVGSIIEIGKSLGIEVLAEGVETMKHAKVLKSLGCNALQGHAFAQAMSATEFAAFARARKLREAS